MSDKVFYTNVDRFGNDILVRGYKNSKQFSKKIRYLPSLFVYASEKTPFRTLDGKYLQIKNPGTMKQCRDYIQEMDTENSPIYGNQNYIHQFIAEGFESDIVFDRSIINVTTIDIEVKSEEGFPKPEEAAYPVTAITVKNNIDDTFYTWGMGDYDKKKTILENVKVVYTKCANEKELLTEFILHWSANYPDVITGWNSRLFDTVYLINRLTRILGEDMARKISPWNNFNQTTINIAGREHQAYAVTGIQQLDYLDLFRKFGYSYGTQESYKLDHIANVVLGDKKIDYSEYGSLNDLYRENYQLFIDYNIKDVQIVDRLEDKMGLITLCMTVAYKAKVNMVEAMGSVGVWDALIFNEFKRRGIVVPPKREIKKLRQIEGAYVKDPQNGMHNWVVSFDLNSLYPHIIMQYNMSPETIINGNADEVTVDKLLANEQFPIPDDACMSATGQYFSTKVKGLMPTMVEQLYQERTVFKKKMLDAKQKLEHVDKKDKKAVQAIEREINIFENQQMAVKILMNSLYGAMSNEFFRYYDIRIAESITVSGQLTIRWAERTINNWLNKLLKTNKDYVIAIDTDSLYIDFGDFVQSIFKDDQDTDKIVKFLDKICGEKIEPLLAKSYDELKEFMKAPEQKMVMKREVIANKGIWTGKKHYVLNVHNSEGVQYAKPKLKIMGIEAVRSSTPKPCRSLIIDTLNVIMNEDEKAVHKFIENAREEFNKLPAEDVAFPRGVNNLDKYIDSASIYRKATPIHVRGALLYNHYLQQYGLENKYEQIYSGEKIKFAYLKLPNKFREDVVAFPAVIPDEFGIREFVDYEKQLDKAYLEPLRTILDAIGWKTEKQHTLESFFE